MGKVFSKCCECVGDQDNDGDRGDLKDMLYGTTKILTAMGTLLLKSKAVVNILKTHGVRVGEVEELITNIEEAVTKVDSSIERFIELPARLRELGDANQDGSIDFKDVIHALANPRVESLQNYLQDIAAFLDALEDAGIEVAGARENLARIEATLAKVDKKGEAIVHSDLATAANDSIVAAEVVAKPSGNKVNLSL